MRNTEVRSVTLNMPRQSNIELLRIFAMVMVIAHHLAIFSGFNIDDNVLSANALWVRFLSMGGKIGVNVFMLISGYFSVSSQRFRSSKLIKLWLQMLFYSVGSYIVFVLIGVRPFNPKTLLLHCAPVITRQWWFASVFIILYVFSPYINKLIKSLDKRQYKFLLLMVGLIWCVIPTITRRNPESNDLLWLMYVYVLGGYLRLHASGTKRSGIVLIMLACVLGLLTFVAAVSFKLLGSKLAFLKEYEPDMFGLQSLPVLVISLLLFMGFSKMNIRYSCFINLVSSATFGIYLIHDTFLMRQFLWNKLFKNASFYEMKVFIPYTLLELLMLFIVCTAIELLRIHLLEKNYMPAIEKLGKRLEKKIPPV